MKKLILSTLLVGSLFAQDQQNRGTFIDSIMDDITSTVDSNLTQKVKIDTIKDYIKNIEFNEDIDTSKYKFNIMGHHENYMLLASATRQKLYNKHWTNGVQDNQGYDRDSNEAQFQISIKVPLYSNFLNSGGDLFTGYTQNSYWQVYNTDKSSPFRETNYMPELFMDWHPQRSYGDSKLHTIRFALIHQSNGQDVGQSRSWNRTEMMFLFKLDNIYYGMNIWDRWNEKAKKDITSTEGDDNPGLEDLIGNQKYFIKYRGDRYSITLSHQNDIMEYDINKGNTKLDLTFPSPNKNVDFFVRGFSGYGESLVDYDVKIQRLSFGIMIADWI